MSDDATNSSAFDTMPEPARSKAIEQHNRAVQDAKSPAGSDAESLHANPVAGTECPVPPNSSLGRLISTVVSLAGVFPDGLKPTTPSSLVSQTFSFSAEALARVVADLKATSPSAPAAPLGCLSGEDLLQIETRYGQATGGTWTIEDEATRQREVTQSLMAVIVHAGGVARRLTGLSERP